MRPLPDVPTYLQVPIQPLILTRESYLAAIENCIGSAEYQTLYMQVNGVAKDVLDAGELACAWSLSSILHRFALLDEPQVNVPRLLQCMGNHNWYQIQKPRDGAVIVWDSRLGRKSRVHHYHIGFAKGNGLHKPFEAISAYDKTHVMTRHPYRLDGRVVIHRLWHNALNE
jgi:hypothetical protein